MKYLKGVVSVTLKNGKKVTGHWEKRYRDVHVTCYDDEFSGTWSIDTTDEYAEKDAKWCLIQLIKSKGGII